MQIKTLLVTLAPLVTALPALAEPQVMLLLRDSDGIVISVLHPVDYGPVLATGAVPGTVFYTFNGEVLPTATMHDVMTAGAAPTLELGGTTYQVEAAGDNVWLRDLATGQRFRAERQVAVAAPDAAGLKVNPAVLTLD